MNELALLKDLIKVTKDGEWGKSLPSNDAVEMLVIRGTDFSSVRYGDLSGVPKRFIPNQIAERKCLRPNDILIETAGGTKEQPTGRTVFLKKRLFDETNQVMTCASFSRFLRIDPTLVYPEYIFWYLQYLYETGQMEQHQVQHTGVARFQYTNFAQNIEIPLPSISEQLAIAHILGTLDDKIELNRRMNETLEAMAQAIFKSWFVDFDPVRAKAEGRKPAGLDAATAALFPDSFQDSPLGKIPKRWRQSKIGAEIETVLGGTPSRTNSDYWECGTIPWINSGKANEFRIIEPSENITLKGLECSATKLLPERTTVIAITGATLGKVSLLEISACANQSIVGVLGSTEFPSEFLYFWIKTNINELVSRQTGGAQQHVNKNNVNDLSLLCPPTTVINQYLQLVRPIFDSIKERCFESRSLATMRDVFLPKLLSGELRVPGEERNVKEV